MLNRTKSRTKHQSLGLTLLNARSSYSIRNINALLKHLPKANWLNGISGFKSGFWQDLTNPFSTKWSSLTYLGWSSSHKSFFTSMDDEAENKSRDWFDVTRRIFSRTLRNGQTFISINAHINGIERKTIFYFLIRKKHCSLSNQIDKD